jgi:alkaline phosphatase
MKGAPSSAPRVLGLFAAEDLFVTGNEEELREKKVPRRVDIAPTISEMTDFALRFLGGKPNGFLLAINSEAADNYATNLNARDTLAAMEDDDRAIGLMLRFAESRPKTHVMVLADGGEGGFAPIGWLRPGEVFERDKPLPATDSRSGAQIHGRDGMETPPFLTAADESGTRHAFAVSFAARAQHGGGVVVRAAGHRADLVRGSMDTTDVYRVLYDVLFDKALPRRK